MLERLLDWERPLFFMLNGSNSPVLDRFMWLYSDMTVWIPVAVLIIVILVYRQPWREIVLIVLAIVLLVTLCDQFSSHVCKPLFMRFRPTHHPDFMNEVKTVFDYRGGLYGFISGHATNSFGFAMLISLLFRYRPFTFAVFLWAFLNAYSRIYLGVHFISDIVAGALAGICIGLFVYAAYVTARNKWSRGQTSKPADLYSEKQKQAIISGIFLTILVLLAFNVPLTQLLSPMF
jgi:undecaprenyl-diphosphatase